jgi:hypothetical protein
MPAAKELKKRRPTRWIGMMDPPRRPAPRSAHYIFVACAAEEYATVVRPVIDAAELDGHRFWIEHRAARSTEDIAAAIDGSAALLVFCSQMAATSLALYRHVARASLTGKPVVAVSLDGSPLPDALLFYISESEAIDATQPDWRLRLNLALDRVDAGRRRAPPPAVAPRAFSPRTVVVAPQARAAAPRRKSYAQSFINAFAAGAIALFAFAMIELTGGPPTEREIERVVTEVQDAAEEVVLSTPI